MLVACYALLSAESTALSVGVVERFGNGLFSLFGKAGTNTEMLTVRKGLRLSRRSLFVRIRSQGEEQHRMPTKRKPKLSRPMPMNWSHWSSNLLL